MKKYIPTLMEVYQEMIKENKEEFPKYSDTMLHNLISIINKLNNHKR